ncbi:L-cystine-binding protein FliY [compost metagenome]
MSRVLAALLVTCLLPAAAMAQTLERIRATQTFTIGYLADLAPFSAGAEGRPEGFAIDLCAQIAEQLKAVPELARLQVRHVPQAGGQAALEAVREGRIDLLCTPVAETLERRRSLSFSLPVYTAGRVAAVRRDASPDLLRVLGGGAAHEGPTWRATINRGLSNRRFAVQAGSPAEAWARDRLRLNGVIASIVPVDSPNAGLDLVAAGKADAYFSDRLLLQTLVARRSELRVLDQLFELEPAAFALARDDEDFRLLVDSALSRVYRSGQIEALYRRYFGAPSAQTLQFYQLYSRP